MVRASKFYGVLEFGDSEKGETQFTRNRGFESIRTDAISVSLIRVSLNKTNGQLLLIILLHNTLCT